MIKRLELEKALKNAAFTTEVKLGIEDDVVKLSDCLNIVREYFISEPIEEEKDVQIAKLEAKVFVYEQMIQKFNFAPLSEVSGKEVIICESQ